MDYYERCKIIDEVREEISARYDRVSNAVSTTTAYLLGIGLAMNFTYLANPADNSKERILWILGASVLSTAAGCFSIKKIREKRDAKLSKLELK
jgi:hypothetical protein